jgi:hypothetical protein
LFDFIHSLLVFSLIGFLPILVVFLSSTFIHSLGGWKGVGTRKLDHRIIQVPYVAIGNGLYEHIRAGSNWGKPMVLWFQNIKKGNQWLFLKNSKNHPTTQVHTISP